MEEKPIYYVRNHPMYPERLKVLADSPEGLYVLGNLPEPGKKSVAIVGARACSAYGRKQARYFAGSLAARGIQVISGLAAGIDAAAHEVLWRAEEKPLQCWGAAQISAIPGKITGCTGESGNRAAFSQNMSREWHPMPGTFPGETELSAVLRI